jgi:ferredoxin
MAYVITEPCADVKDKSCMTVCPCDCIQEGKVEHEGNVYDQLFINPAECIDCGLCETVCPVNAIFLDIDVPAKWRDYIAINAERFHSRPPR